MIGKSWSDYIGIRLSIAGLLLVAPASIIYIAGSALRGNFLISPWIALVAIPEAAFYLLVYLPRRRLLQKASINPPPPLNPEERKALFQRCLNVPKHPSSPNFKPSSDPSEQDSLLEHHVSDSGYPAGWFLSPDIQKENVRDWILWAMFSADSGEALAEWNEEIDEYIHSVEKTLGRRLEDGRNPKANSMRLTFDPVLMTHRPMIWYFIVMGVDIYTSLSLMYHGFRHYAPSKWLQAFPPRPLTVLSERSADPNIPYWYRPHRSETKLPVLFLHGIGIGLYPYMNFFKELFARDPDVGIIMIELLPICMHITKPPLSRPATLDGISHILDTLNLPRVVVVSHSYGTVITSHMLHSPSIAPRIAATVFIDPIPFLLHLPNVAYNFLYRHPRDANEWQLWYFASRDSDVSRALARNFFWTESILWKEDVQGKKVAVALSGADQIVNSEGVWQYLTEEAKDISRNRWERDGLEVLFFPGCDHATIFDHTGTRASVLDVVERFVEDA